MQPNFFIRYKGVDQENDSQIDMVAFGESIIGLDTVIREIFKISKIKGNISIDASQISEGSLIVDIIIAISNIANAIPFDKVPDFLNFLRIVDQNLYTQASEFFNAIGNVHNGINEFAKEYPVDYDLMKTFITLFIGILIGKAGKHKKHPNLDDLPKPYAIALHKMVVSGKFKKALKPFVENEISSIEVSNQRDFSLSSIVDGSNFENYLGEDEQILPYLKNGTVHNLKGKIVGMQCSRGDSLKIKISIKPKKYMSLIAFPPPKKTTKEFDEFYGQNVSFTAKIERKSLYQKPKLHIVDMSIQQQSLFDK